MADLKGQIVIPAEPAGAIAVPVEINHLVGVAETLITKPSRAKLLVLSADVNAFRFKAGDYIAKTFVVVLVTTFEMPQADLALSTFVPDVVST